MAPSSLVICVFSILPHTPSSRPRMAPLLIQGFELLVLFSARIYFYPHEICSADALHLSSSWSIPSDLSVPIAR